ncbi:MAG: ParB N-terminal domain-containing protein [Thermoprotei archaeon]
MSLRYMVDSGRNAFEFELAAVSVSSLKPHEKVFEDAVRSLAADMRSSTMQREPIVVDRDSMTVLDGMHRLSAARMLGLKFLLAVLVDYDANSIRLERWWRSIRAFPDSLLKTIEEKTAGNRGEPFIVVEDGVEKTYRLKTTGEKAFEEYETLVSNIERTLGVDATPTPQPLSRGVSFGAPHLTKTDVKRMASRGLLLPAKTTRHIFPLRVLSCPVPLRLLAEERQGGKELLRDAVSAYIRPMDVWVAEGKDTYGGRYYDDEKLLFFI